MPPQKEKRRSGDLGRGNDLEKWARKIKANVGDIPPRWVPGIVAALVAIFAWSAWEASFKSQLFLFLNNYCSWYR